MHHFDLRMVLIPFLTIWKSDPIPSNPRRLWHKKVKEVQSESHKIDKFNASSVLPEVAEIMLEGVR